MTIYELVQNCKELDYVPFTFGFFRRRRDAERMAKKLQKARKCCSFLVLSVNVR